MSALARPPASHMVCRSCERPVASDDVRIRSAIPEWDVTGARP
ncbi:hypothetical protein [Planobispora takensis]|nr:hypothetical protein [Planobispora takensis]